MFYNEYSSKETAIAKALELSKNPVKVKDGKEVFLEYTEYGVYTEINDFGKRIYGVTESSNLLFKRCFALSTHLYNAYKGELE